MRINRRTVISALSIMLFNIAYAQQTTHSLLYGYVTEKRKAEPVPASISLFEKSNAPVSGDIQKILGGGQMLILKKEESKALYQNKPAGISLNIPYGEETITLELVQEDISTKETETGKLTGNGKQENTRLAKPLHYRGYQKDYPSSIAAITIFDNGELMCLFANPNGNFNLGNTDNGKYILYNNRDMKASIGFQCSTDESVEVTGTGPGINRRIFEPLAPVQPLCNKVRIYWEADYKLFNYNFANNYTNTINYLSGLFNQMAVMYSNEGIIIELSAVNVWTTPDTFTTTSSATGLNAIRNRWNALGNNFNGDLCMLIDGGTTNNGGRAYLLTNGICSRNIAYGYANVYGHYNNVPTYSWDVEVITHETGHNMGSHHTHWCGWNTGTGGTCGAIDDCSAVETSTGCTTCSAATVTNPGAPAGFTGTVMSYCHLRSGIGINLSNGFGTLPKAFIRSNISNSSCLIQQNNWTGNIDTAWENPSNWSCGTIPNTNTDVTIPAGRVNYPVVNSNAFCRKLNQLPGSTVTVNPEYSIDVSGH